MVKAKKPENEKSRIENLKSYQLLDTLSETEFDEMTELASYICQTPIALISLVDDNRQWFKSKKGVDVPETPRDIAFCAHAILGSQLFEVCDTLKDERFAQNPLVTDGVKIRFYAGMPLVSNEGFNLGTICVIDNKPKSLNEDQKKALRIMSHQIVRLFESRRNLSISKLNLKQIEQLKNDLDEAQRVAKIGSWKFEFETQRLQWSKELFHIFDLNENDQTNLYQNYLSRIHPEDLPKLEACIRSAVESGKGYEVEHRIVLSTGETRHILGKADVIKNNASGEGIKVVGLLGTAQDISAEVIVKNELLHHQANLVAKSKMATLGEMAGGLAHEVNNPLTIIDAKVQSLLSKIKTNQIDNAYFTLELERVKKGVDRIAKIIKGLRNFSRESDSDPMSVTDFKTIVEDTLELCQEKIRRLGINLEIQIESDSKMKSHPEQIAQVLLNLLNNSCDAISELPQKWISVKAEKTDEGLNVYVRDSGAGIQPEIANKIMNPFFTTKEVGKGTGLGLSISYGICKAHQGNLSYIPDSKNTCFLIQLPLLQNQLRHSKKKAA